MRKSNWRAKSGEKKGKNRSAQQVYILHAAKHVKVGPPSRLQPSSILAGHCVRVPFRRMQEWSTAASLVGVRPRAGIPMRLVFPTPVCIYIDIYLCARARNKIKPAPCVAAAAAAGARTDERE